MTNFLVKGASLPGTRINLGFFSSSKLSRNCLQHNTTTAFRIHLPPCRNLSSYFRQGASPKMYWRYLCAGTIAAFSVYQVYLYFKKRGGNLVSSIYSDGYQACYYSPMPTHITKRMVGKSYKEACPIPISDLAYVKVSHYDMTQKNCKRGNGNISGYIYS